MTASSTPTADEQVVDHEHEHGECEAAHGRRANLAPCSVQVVAVAASACVPQPYMICAAVAQQALERMAKPQSYCACGRFKADCWSVVMLP